MIFWFFGYPGVGKDYVAKKLAQVVNIPHVDADDFLTESDKQKLIKGSFTSQDRIRKLKRITVFINKLLLRYPHLAVADSLPDNESRKMLFNTFMNNIIFVYVQASKTTHVSRIKGRKSHFFTKEMIEKWIKQHWEPINIPYISLQNSGGGKLELEKKLLNIFLKSISPSTVK